MVELRHARQLLRRVGKVSIPTDAVEVPRVVAELAGDASLAPVWANEIGGFAFRADAPDGSSCYIKYGPHNLEVSMFAEAERLSWAGQYTIVPTVIEVGSDHTHEWLITEAIDGSTAVAPEWLNRPEVAVRAVGRGLRQLHDALPVNDCPWLWDPYSRIANAESRGRVIPDHLRTPPPDDLLVVAHGDACIPNTLLTTAGDPLAHVDLGALGIADRWADIAVASMSTNFDFGPGFEDMLIEAYGIEPDRERLAYYRELWDAT